MVEIRRSPRQEEIRQSARHTLFVEGKDENSLDRRILEILLGNRIRVESLGPSFHIQSVAEALYKHHPDYYFLIDRDHHNDQFINDVWVKFPDPSTSNLLVWPRRELENYFLIPEYLLLSEHLRVKEEKLREFILQYCQERLYIDTANQVILTIREDFKKNWIRLFTHIEDFTTKDVAIQKLLKASEFDIFKKKVSNALRKNAIECKFEQIFKTLTGGIDPLEYNHGRWLELLKGKAILAKIMNRCFTIKDLSGNILQGQVKLYEITKDLVSKPFEYQPDDFQRLHKIITDRIGVI